MADREPAQCDREAIVPDDRAIATEERAGKAKNPHAVALGRLGGLKGGRIAAENMTPEQRRKRARKAALARWRKRKSKGKK